MNSNGYKCDRGGDILAYIYNEGDAAGRMAFESHLVDCTACTDEFAEVSLARYSVFEWQKEEFAHLPTPEFTIPYQVRSTAGSGLFAGLLDMLKVTRWPALAAAAIVLSIGIGLTTMVMFNPNIKQVAGNPGNAAIPAPLGPDAVQNVIKGDGPEKVVPVERAETIQTIKKTVQQPRRADTVSPQRSRLSTVAAADVRDLRDKKATVEVGSTANVRRSSTAVASAPVLSNFEDIEDGSLRLTDMLEDGGS